MKVVGRGWLGGRDEVGFAGSVGASVWRVCQDKKIVSQH